MTPEVLEAIVREGGPAALATVVSTLDSVSRDPGARMAILGSGKVVGSVSGGCVEGAVAEAAMGVLLDGRARLLTYGVADELAATVGVTCGGTIRVWIERVGGDTGLGLAAVGAAFAEQRALAIAIRLTAPL